MNPRLRGNDTNKKMKLNHFTIFKAGRLTADLTEVTLLLLDLTDLGLVGGE